MKKASTGQIKKTYIRVYIGRFDYLPKFNFGPKKLAIKKITKDFGKQLKVAYYAGCQNTFIVKRLVHFFWPFLKAQGDKLVPHSQISFKSR